MPPNLLLIYLHGFLSSPQSQKAQQTLRYCEARGMAEQILIPQMRHGPAKTAREIERLIKQNSRSKIVLIGSSLGGYYASYLSEKFDLPAALINPAVHPYELWESHLGEQRNYYSNEIHIVEDVHIKELYDLDIPFVANPENFLVLVQTGDETLDYRQAVKKFAESACVIRQNGNHSFENFEDELPLIFDFFLSRIG